MSEAAIAPTGGETASPNSGESRWPKSVFTFAEITTGVIQVLEAFKTAKDKISVNTLVATLKKLDYIYPYPQAIGFYLERAGYSEKQWSRLLKLKSSFDFYLAHGLPAKKNYDKRWGLYYPGGL